MTRMLIVQKKNDGEMSKLLREMKLVLILCIITSICSSSKTHLWFFSAPFTFSVHGSFMRWILLLNFLRVGITQSLENSMKVSFCENVKLLVDIVSY